MKLLLVAQDANPSRSFAKLAEAYPEFGITPTLAVADGKDFPFKPWELKEMAKEADFILVGMSSDRKLAVPEWDVCKVAGAFGVPYGLYSDSWGCFSREWFADFRDEANLLFVLNKMEATAARNLFTKARIIPSGNIIWEEFSFLGKNRRSMRGRINAGERKVILVPGTKDGASNVSLLAALVKALLDAEETKGAMVFFAVHPGDKTNHDSYRKYAVLSSDWGLSTNDLLEAADVVVSASSATTDVAACFLRIPVVNFLNTRAKERIKRESGDEIPELVKRGVILPALDSAGIRMHLRSLFCEMGAELRETLRDHEEKMFPVAASPGETANVILRAIRDTVFPAR